MRTPYSPELERISDAITLLKRGPMTASEIANVLEVRPDSVRKWCRTFVDKGHAVEAGVKFIRNQPAQAWRWA